MSPLLILGLIAAIIGIGYLLLSVRYVPNNAVGVLEKEWRVAGLCLDRDMGEVAGGAR